MDDATPLSDAEKIRLKRLAKLQQQDQRQTSSDPSAPSNRVAAAGSAQSLVPKPVLEETPSVATSSRVTKAEAKVRIDAVEEKLYLGYHVDMVTMWTCRGLASQVSSGGIDWHPRQQKAQSWLGRRTLCVSESALSYRASHFFQPTTLSVTAPKPSATPKSFEDWQSEALSRILQVTLDLAKVTGTRDHILGFVISLGLNKVFIRYSPAAQRREQKRSAQRLSAWACGGTRG
ncbi:hypothetical protein BC937DRAFT_95104 [Endogone sp. FLAS-F59071]|nr:hypothetical protein BC937DRAFT_95104 [Endogone sp. FLAS-F59071]|eukprot:RUS13575.1 hypothetical protein BC937DRAFT_95104 [Endogone sp. FLAS-F59071]